MERIVYDGRLFASVLVAFGNIALLDYYHQSYGGREIKLDGGIENKIQIKKY